MQATDAGREQPALGARGGLPAVRADDLAANTFSGGAGALDRVGHRRDDPGWVDAVRRGPAAWFLVLTAGKAAPLARGDRLWWVRRDRAPLDGASAVVYLGRDAGAGDAAEPSRGGAGDYFAVGAAPGAAEELAEAEGGGTRVASDPRQLAGLLTEGEASVLAQSRALLSFHDSHRFCGRCGSRTRLTEAGWRRACEGDGCGRSAYPRTDPVVIAMVEHPEDRGLALLGRKKAWPAGRFSCLAGFLESGESAEEAVRREVLEESGVRVGRVLAHSSQPWPFLGNQLMLGFHAKALTAELGGLDDELECVRWFTRDELRGMLERSRAPWAAAAGDDAAEPPTRTAPPYAIAHTLIRAWVDGAVPEL